MLEEIDISENCKVGLTDLAEDLKEIVAFRG
jgi:hypothetical protein